jgi:hypothetical protein
MIEEQKEKISLEGLDKRIDGLEIRIDKFEKDTKSRFDRMDESQRKIGFQLERLDHKFDLCFEGFGSLKERTDLLEDRVAKLEERI